MWVKEKSLECVLSPNFAHSKDEAKYIVDVIYNKTTYYIGYNSILSSTLFDKMRYCGAWCAGRLTLGRAAIMQARREA